MRPRSRSRFLSLTLAAAFACVAASSTAEAQSGAQRVRAPLAPSASAPQCHCPIAPRANSQARLCDGSQRLEQSSSHSNGSGLVCSSLSLLDVEEEDGRCALAGDRSSCTAEVARPCTARYKFAFAVHASACHQAPPNGFWISSVRRPRLRLFRSVGMESTFAVVLRPRCGACEDETLVVAMPDGANGGPGTVIYRHQVAVDCGSCAAQRTATTTGGSAPCVR
ncbi:MAG: hypothetical protein IPN34_00045 [Planctomycetes bacterium]|nr:hypothetical protein [Planctomycetota bacterium]